MLITLFIESSGEEKAIQFLTPFIEMTENYNMNTFLVSIEDYWKIDDMYKIELKAAELSKNQLRNFFNQIASKWMELPDELLASKTMEDCVIYLENLYMVTIHFE